MLGNPRNGQSPAEGMGEGQSCVPTDIKCGIYDGSSISYSTVVLPVWGLQFGYTLIKIGQDTILSYKILADRTNAMG
jgi:hypothetical protein